MDVYERCKSGVKLTRAPKPQTRPALCSEFDGPNKKQAVENFVSRFPKPV